MAGRYTGCLNGGSNQSKRRGRRRRGRPRRESRRSSRESNRQAGWGRQRSTLAPEGRAWGWQRRRPPEPGTRTENNKLLEIFET